MSGYNDSDPLAVGFLEKPYKVVVANGGGINFTITHSTMGTHSAYRLELLKKECPHKPGYVILLDSHAVLFDTHIRKRIKFVIPSFYFRNTHDFWLTWYNDVICIGTFNEPPLLKYPGVNTSIDKMIGFVKFETVNENGRTFEWIVQSTSEVYTYSAVPKQVSGGELRWVQMHSSDTLPIDALIGGFENEPLYIARATHNGSLCPGKYMKSKQLAYVPWGEAEHAKSEFEVLCGYDAIWAKCSDNNIPDNAFIGGYSEVNSVPLFIGRACVRNYLVVGKVHMLYRTCYVPYNKKEIVCTDYEILVIGNKVARGYTTSYMTVTCCCDFNKKYTMHNKIYC